MPTKGDNSVGRFHVELDIANHRDVIKAEEGALDLKKVRRARVRGLVDSDAARLVLPRALARQLGLPVQDKVQVRYADGRKAKRDAVSDVHIDLQGRHGTFTAIVEPGRTETLIGAIVLEDLDFLIDCLHQRLVPRDPRFVISEIE